MTATHGVGTYGNAVGTVTPLDHKMAQLGLILKTAANTIRAGVFWDGNTTIVSGKANMSYDVRALAAVLTRSATAGAVLLTNDSVYNVLTTAAPGSNSRYDVVYLWQREFSLDGTDSNPVIGVIQGTPAASPTVPSLAAFPGAIALAQILVPAGVTATNTGTTITQTGPFTSVDGGVVVSRTTTELAAYTPNRVDARAFNLADSTHYRWNGAAWKAWESDFQTLTLAAAIASGVTLGGTGTSSFRWRYCAGRVLMQGTATISAGGSFVSPVVTLPVAAVTPLYSGKRYSIGSGDFVHAAANYPLNIYANGVSATQANIAQATVPAGGFTATNPVNPQSAGDSFSFELEYDPA